MSIEVLVLRHKVVVLYSLGFLIFILSGLAWFCHLQNNPEHVFYSAIRQGLFTRSVTVQTEATSQSATLKLATQMEFSPTQVARSLDTVQSQGNTVTTEVIGTPKADYARYISVKLAAKNASSKPTEIPNLANTWGKKDVQSATSSANAGIFEQFLVGYTSNFGAVLPLADLSSGQASSVFGQIKKDKLYTVDFAKVKTTSYNHRSAYSYDVSVSMGAEVRITKILAARYGVTKPLSQVNPAAYDGRHFTVRMTVDKMSRHVVEVSATDGSSAQRYSGYDVTQQIIPPTKSVSLADLQEKLSSDINKSR